MLKLKLHLFNIIFSVESYFLWIRLYIIHKFVQTCKLQYLLCWWLMHWSNNMINTLTTYKYSDFLSNSQFQFHVSSIIKSNLINVTDSISFSLPKIHWLVHRNYKKCNRKSKKYCCSSFRDLCRIFYNVMLLWNYVQFIK